MDNMTNSAILSLPRLKEKTGVLVFTSLFAISIGAPMIVHSQFITGPLVNAILIIATIMFGPFSAVIIGLVPSTVALGSGLLPLPLAPMVPFIMLSNVLFVAMFDYARNKGFGFAVVLAGFVKFVFLYAIVNFLMNTLLQAPLVSKLSLMMGWTQFVTALAGGVIAFIVLKKIKKI